MGSCWRRSLRGCDFYDWGGGGSCQDLLVLWPPKTSLLSVSLLVTDLKSSASLFILSCSLCMAAIWGTSRSSSCGEWLIRSFIVDTVDCSCVFLCGSKKFWIGFMRSFFYVITLFHLPKLTSYFIFRVFF